MPTSYKRLGTAVGLSTKTIVYTVPANKQAIISSLVVTNNADGPSRNFSVHALSAAADSATSANSLGFSMTIAPYTTVAFTEGWTLGPGQTIAVTCPSNNGVNFNLFGCEIS